MKENIFHIDDLVMTRSYEEAGEFGYENAFMQHSC